MSLYNECNRAFLAQRIKPNFVSKHKQHTNADRIRAMSDEELAEFMEDAQTWGGCPNHGARDCTSDCGSCWAVWLKSPVEVDK